MKNWNLIESVLLSNPIYRGMIEFLLLIGSGILGLFFSWPKLPFFPVLNILGGILILSGLLFHVYAGKNHKQAHEKSADIVKIVNNGVFSKLRHPLYLSAIIINLGIALAFGVVLTFLIAVCSIFHWVMTALKEEEFLLQKFGEEYRQYKKNVRWRFLPKIF
ncbi:methyltransferase family protein [Thermodesulfobacteriota bacterium]